MIGDQIDCDDSQRELIMKASEMNDDGRISEINFIEYVRSMAQIFYAREKKERKPPIYDWKLLRMNLESKDIRLKSFLNLLEKLINPTLLIILSHNDRKASRSYVIFSQGLKTNTLVH